MIGLEQGIVKLVPYRSGWRQLFEDEKARLVNAVGKDILDIQHVGSTSIPGLVAKPIIDIAIAVRDYDEAKECIEPITHLGYEYRGENGIARRHFFVLGNPRLYHLHVNEVGSRAWENQILFRDYLVEHSDRIDAYATLKQDLANRYPTDREAYLLGKASFIEGILHIARKGL